MTTLPYTSRADLLAALALLIAGTTASTASASHAWGNYHWARTANPFTIKAGDNVDANWDAYLDMAISDWNASSVMNVVKVAGSTTGRKCRATSGRIEVCNAAYGNNGWLGLASISITGGTHITQGTAKLNDTYYASAKYNTPEWRAHVMCQEVGHDFGLGHQDESGADFHTCMDYVSAPHEHSKHPNQHDYDQLVTIYSHLDSSTTIGASVKQSEAEKEDSQADKVERWDKIKSSEIVEHFKDGSKRITEVYWAL